MTYTETDMQGWIGRDLVDQSGDRIGEIAALYYDDQTGQPSWCTVKTGWFGRNVSFVPLAGTTSGDDALVSTYTKDKVKDAPSIDPDKHLSPDEERMLYEYYGFEFGDRNQGTGEFGTDAGQLGTDTGQDTSGPETDVAMTRSEEELDVARTSRQAGTARLRKWVETEHESVTVPRSREEVRVEREPVTDANIDQAMDGPEISEEEHEMPLYEEEVVAQKQTVPKERVRIDKAVVTENERVEGDVRKERIDVDSDTGRE